MQNQSKPRIRVLTMEELRALHAAAETDQERDLVRLMCECGPRVKEIANMTPEDVVDTPLHVFLSREWRRGRLCAHFCDHCGGWSSGEHGWLTARSAGSWPRADRRWIGGVSHHASALGRQQDAGVARRAGRA